MTTKIIMSAILMASFLLISSGFVYNDNSLSDDKKKMLNVLIFKKNQK